MKIIFHVLVILMSLSVTYGATMRANIETGEVFGKAVKFCTYKDIKMLPRSVFKDYDACMKCICSRKGLSCVDVKYSDDSEFISVVIGCKSRWVLKNNNRKRCPKTLIPPFTLLGK